MDVNFPAWRRMGGVIVLALGVLAAPAIGQSQPSDGRPQRIVSTNLCADELLLALADRSQIRSVTWLVKDPAMSLDAAAAADIPANHGLAEEVILHEPDLILAGRFSAPATVGVLKRLGFEVKSLGHPTSIDDVRRLILEVAELVGHPARGAALVAEIDRRLQRLAASSLELSAVYFQANGVTTGPGSLADDVLARAGLRNLVVERGLDQYDRYPLELLVFDAPDLLVTNDQRGVRPAVANELLAHSVLARRFPGARRVAIPGQLWSCGTHRVVEAAEILARAAHALATARTGAF